MPQPERSLEKRLVAELTSYFTENFESSSAEAKNNIAVGLNRHSALACLYDTMIRSLRRSKVTEVGDDRTRIAELLGLFFSLLPVAVLLLT